MKDLINDKYTLKHLLPSDWEDYKAIDWPDGVRDDELMYSLELYY